MVKSIAKGATNGSTRTTVAKAGAKKDVRRKVSDAKRQGTASIPVGTNAVRYRFTAAERDYIKDQLQQRPSITDRGAKKHRAASPTQESNSGDATYPGRYGSSAGYTGPKVKTLMRLATAGLILVGFVAGCLVGKVWL